jgi:hypothetical protein
MSWERVSYRCSRIDLRRSVLVKRGVDCISSFLPSALGQPFVEVMRRIVVIGIDEAASTGLLGSKIHFGVSFCSHDSSSKENEKASIAILYIRGDGNYRGMSNGLNHRLS